MEHLDQVTQGAAWFEDLLKYESAVAVIVAIVGSWCFTMLFLAVIRNLTVLRWRVTAVQLFDAGVAFAFCASMWKHGHRWQFAAFFGALSPVAYYALTALACWWRPGLRRFIRLTELAAIDEAAANTPSGESP